MTVMDAPPTETCSISFNPLDPGLIEDPYPIYEKLRADMPVHFEESLGWWFVMNHQLAKQALSDAAGDQRFVEMQQMRLGRDATDEPYCVGLRDFLIGKTGDDHRRVRRAIQKNFTPARVADLRAEMWDTAHDLIDRLGPSGEADLMDIFAMPLPLATISRLLGIAEERQAQIESLLRHFKLATESLPLSEEQLEQVNGSIGGLTEYFRPLIAERRESLGHDLLSMLIREADAGRLTESELNSNTWGLYAAGHETSANTICSGVMTLLQHPDQLQHLRDDLSLAAQAADEVLRFCAPAQATHRMFESEVVVGQHTIPAHSPVVVYLASANRDPQWCGNPDIFDITRNGPTDHLAFGWGRHSCVGRHLAKLTLEIALEVLVGRLNGLRLAGPIEWDRENLPFRAPLGLRIGWDAVAERPA